MGRKKELLKNIIILGIGNIIPRLSNLIILPLLTGILSKEEYGLYDLIVSLTTLFLPLATLQIQAAAFRFLIGEYKRENRTQIITNVICFTVLSSTLVLSILFFILHQLNFYIKILIIIYYLIDIYVETIKQIARGLSQNKIYSKGIMVYSLTQLILFILLVTVLKYGLIGTLLSLIIGLLISGIYISIKIKLNTFMNFKYFSKKTIIELIEYSWPMIPNSLSSWIVSLSDKMIITIFLGVEKTAIYAVANKLPNLFTILQGTFNLAWQENACISVNDREVNKYYEEMFDNLLKFLIGIMAMLIAITPILFKILIRGDYLNSYNHILILYLATIFSSLSSYIGGIYLAYKKTKEIGITTFIAAIINIVINITLIHKIGIYAASFSTLLSYLILFLYRSIKIKHIYGIKFKYFSIIKYFSILFIMLILSILEQNFLNFIIGFITFMVINKILLLKIFNRFIS